MSIGRAYHGGHDGGIDSNAPFHEWTANSMCNVAGLEGLFLVSERYDCGKGWDCESDGARGRGKWEKNDGGVTDWEHHQHSFKAGGGLCCMFDRCRRMEMTQKAESIDEGITWCGHIPVVNSGSGQDACTAASREGCSGGKARKKPLAAVDSSSRAHRTMLCVGDEAGGYD